MENTTRPYLQANRFFYKFYNYNVVDPGMLEKIPDTLYAYVSRELLFYNKNAENSRMDPMQYNVFLFNLVQLHYKEMHEALINELKK